MNRFNMRKLFIFLAIVSVFVGLLSGCGSSEDDNVYDIYYLNLDVTGMDTQEYRLANDTSDTDTLVNELLTQLSSNPDNDKLIKTIPDGVTVEDYYVKGYVLYLTFNKNYKSLSTKDEVLIRAAIVKTMVQLNNVLKVSFQIKDDDSVTTLQDADGNTIEPMNADSFVENPGAQINSSQEVTVDLYFANEDGTKLVKQEKTFTYSTNKSLELVVLEKLIEGPDDDKLRATLPEETNLINVSLAKNICYVNFDETFLNSQDDTISEEVVLYSIVDSLASLPDIDKVQIQVNGNTDGKVRYNFNLSSFYEMESSLVVDEAEDTTEVESTEENSN